jgi:4-diphosphocytidyl-2-C-methyl-D-erythritol kinase
MPATPPPDRVVVSAPAKVNLFLHVGNRRADGFHDLESLATFVFRNDLLVFERDEDLSLSVTGWFAADVSNGEDNLVLKAARLLATRSQTNLGARITLQKLIPVAAGLGGGSADAAATLRGLAKLWNLDASPEFLHQIAAELGSDVPACMNAFPAWMEGRGERITRLSEFPSFCLVIANPRIPVQTADVFKRLRDRRGVGLRRPDEPFADVASLVRFLQTTTNDLEAPAREIAPQIGEVLDEISSQPGVLLTRMTGSGATCFGIFDDPVKSRNAMISMTEQHDDWIVLSGSLVKPGESEPSCY